MSRTIPRAYVTAAWSKTKVDAEDQARKYCSELVKAGYLPLCPVLAFSGIIAEDDPDGENGKQGYDHQNDSDRNTGHQPDLVFYGFILIKSILRDDIFQRAQFRLFDVDVFSVDDRRGESVAQRLGLFNVVCDLIFNFIHGYMYL